MGPIADGKPMIGAERVKRCGLTEAIDRLRSLHEIDHCLTHRLLPGQSCPYENLL